MEEITRVLILGDGASAGQREHALGKAYANNASHVYFCPGNIGTESIGDTVHIPSNDFAALITWAKANMINLVIVGPEAQLKRGAVDEFTQAGIDTFGPTADAARIETDKAFAMYLAEKYHIPHPWYEEFTDLQEALLYIDTIDINRIVLKANGLAGGKGVTLPKTNEEAIEAINAILGDHIPEGPDKKLVVQERLIGREVSILAATDGESILIMPPTEDHKTIFAHDQGPNTGGMGAYAPAAYITEAMLAEIEETILQPAIYGMACEGIQFKGILYAGLIMTQDGPKVIEFNARFGDPETQVIVTLLDIPLDIIVQACIHGNLHEIKQRVSWKQGTAVCIVLASKGYPLHTQAIAKEDIKGVEIIDDPDITIYYGALQGRVLGVTAYGKDLETALQKAYAAIGEIGIHFEGMQFRDDIGRRSS